MTEEDDNGLDAFLKEEFPQISLTKKGKLRKRKPKEPRIYFTKDTEEGILEYLRTEDTDTRNSIYGKRIKYAFYKLVENIIHTFKFYYTDTDTIEELKHEVITFLFEKLHLYKQEKGAAYSYFGTIAKRYLINYNKNNYQKLMDKVDSVITEETEGIEDEIIVSELDDFLGYYVKYIDVHLFKLFPKPRDTKTADAIIELFRRRETIEIFNKKALYVYIREITDTDTPQITRITKKLHKLYIVLFNEYYEKGHIDI